MHATSLFQFGCVCWIYLLRESGFNPVLTLYSFVYNVEKVSH